MQKKDLVIIGSGPAGLSAAIYAQRGMISQVVLEKEMSYGGQIVKTDCVDNYLGLNGKDGYEMAKLFREHADSLHVPFLNDEAKEIRDKKEYKEILLASGEKIQAKQIILATGARYKMLGVPGEKELTGVGVSYCATCDGAFYRGKKVAVVGGGDVALEDALYLANLCKKVYLIHRRDKLRGAKMLQKKIFETENIEFMPFYEVDEIGGDRVVESIQIRQNQTGKASQLSVSGVFVAIGMEPRSELVKGLVEVDRQGYIVAGENCRTSVPNIYAVGDVRTKMLRQIVTAVADGAVAITAIGQDRGK